MEVLNKVKKYKIAVESTLSLNMLEPCEYYIMCILFVVVAVISTLWLERVETVYEYSPWGHMLALSVRDSREDYIVKCRKTL